MLLAKSKGIEAVRTLISFRRHMDEFTWNLMAISKETAKKLLLNEFTTFDELEEYEDEIDFSNTSKISLLYRMRDNENTEKEEFIIETIFIDE